MRVLGPIAAVLAVAMSGCASPDVVSLDTDARELQSASAAPEGLLLAYRYDTTVNAPKRQVASLAEAHERECRDAGPQTCVVYASSVRERNGSVYATLRLRAAPEWLDAFRSSVAVDAQASGGRIVADEKSAEDVTRQIVDTEARLKALRSLRDRRQALLDGRPGDVGDLLAVERELARVQGELEAATATLAVLERRVRMSEQHLHYETKDVGLLKPVFRVIGGALDLLF